MVGQPALEEVRCKECCRPMSVWGSFMCVCIESDSEFVAIVTMTMFFSVRAGGRSPARALLSPRICTGTKQLACPDSLWLALEAIHLHNDHDTLSLFIFSFPGLAALPLTPGEGVQTMPNYVDQQPYHNTAGWSY